MKIRMLQNREIIKGRLSLEKDEIYQVISKSSNGSFYLIRVKDRNVTVTNDECEVISEKLLSRISRFISG